MSMTPLERWLAVLGREKPDRVPMDYWGTNDFTLQLMTYLGCPNKRATLERLHIDFVVKPKAVYVGQPRPRGLDAFGCRFSFVGHETGALEACVTHPLADFESPEEIERNYQWPSPDWWDYSTIADQVKGFEDYPVQAGGSELFTIYRNLRGPDQAFTDLAENPEMVHYILEKLFLLAYQDTLRIFESIPGRVTLCPVAEDLGDPTDLMISPRHIREFLLPSMKRMINVAHEGGAFVFHPDDGNIRRMIPDLIEAGIDVLNPIPWRCPGMERVALKRDFGGAVVFHGGMDNQITLPYGSEEDVRMEVRLNLRILGKGGGYILAPCHNLQSSTPVENVVAMYDTGYAEGQVY
jgi:uroporphyrinogen decarboxylase